MEQELITGVRFFCAAILIAIAEACGYANSSNLSRAFKAHEGMTPGQWLDSHK